MSDELELRLARPQERDAIIVLVNTVFEARASLPRPMERALPLFFADENIRQWAIAVRGHEVVSAVGAHRFDVRSGRLVFGAAHIGAVCTAAEWQGQGIATKLLDLECSLLSSQGVDLAFISGGRRLYLRAGATSHRRFARRYVLPARASDELRLRPLTVESMSEAARLWELEPVTIIRSHEMWTRGLGAIPDRPGWQRTQVMVGEPARAYVVIDYQSAKHEAEVMELAGSRLSALRAARHLAAILGCTTVSVAVPAWDVNLDNSLAMEEATAVPAEDVIAEAESSTYLLLDPVRTFRRVVETVALVDSDIRRYQLLPTERGFELEDHSGVIGSGDRGWACQLLFGEEGASLSPMLPAALPWWRGVTYG